MKIFRKICTVLLGAVFFLSGLLKLIDPVGTGLLVGEYFRFLHLGFLSGASKVFGVGLSLFEATLGVALLSGVWKKVVSYVTLGVLGVFTVITLLLLIFNPNMSCGCFGEALPMTHVQSFLKNVILFALLFAAFFRDGDSEPPAKIKYVTFSVAVASVGLLCLYSLLGLPLMDFTPYAPGVELLRDDDAVLDETTEVMIYRKGRQQGAFLQDALPDSTWTFVRRENYRKNLPDFDAGEEALSFYNAAGDYCDSLAVASNVLLFSVPDPSALDGRDWKAISALSDLSSGMGFNPLILLACLPDDAAEMVKSPELLPRVYFADYRTLLSLNRSNGGATFISDGQIIKKWSSNSYPRRDDLSACLSTDASRYMITDSVHHRVIFQAFVLYSFALLLLI